MNEDKEHTDRLKLVLGEAMKRVPSAVASGSYQVAVQYKADYRKAEKILKKPSPKIADLGWAINAMTGVQMPIDSR
jgi:hypothetical protein